METIKSHSDLHAEIPSQQSFKIDRIHPRSPKSAVGETSWIVDGVSFPNGTEFRCKYKGYFYYAQVINGALRINGKKFLSPSAAAVSITRNSVDGWLFWDCKLPGNSSWVNMCALKQTN
ncbi:MAG: hypothetical protein PVG86_12275 [Desulfobacterales bacterium]|jgi:hypothetical protein